MSEDCPRSGFGSGTSTASQRTLWKIGASIAAIQFYEKAQKCKVCIHSELLLCFKSSDPTDCKEERKFPVLTKDLYFQTMLKALRKKSPVCGKKVASRQRKF